MSEVVRRGRMIVLMILTHVPMTTITPMTKPIQCSVSRIAVFLPDSHAISVSIARVANGWEKFEVRGSRFEADGILPEPRTPNPEPPPRLPPGGKCGKMGGVSTLAMRGATHG